MTLDSFWANSHLVNSDELFQSYFITVSNEKTGFSLVFEKIILLHGTEQISQKKIMKPFIQNILQKIILPFLGNATHDAILPNTLEVLNALFSEFHPNNMGFSIYYQLLIQLLNEELFTNIILKKAVTSEGSKSKTILEDYIIPHLSNNPELNTREPTFFFEMLHSLSLCQTAFQYTQAYFIYASHNTPMPTLLLYGLFLKNTETFLEEVKKMEQNTSQHFDFESRFHPWRITAFNKRLQTLIDICKASEKTKYASKQWSNYIALLFNHHIANPQNKDGLYHQLPELFEQNFNKIKPYLPPKLQKHTYIMYLKYGPTEVRRINMLQRLEENTTSNIDIFLDYCNDMLKYSYTSKEKFELQPLVEFAVACYGNNIVHHSKLGWFIASALSQINDGTLTLQCLEKLIKLRSKSSQEADFGRWFAICLAYIECHYDSSRFSTSSFLNHMPRRLTSEKTKTGQRIEQWIQENPNEINKRFSPPLFQHLEHNETDWANIFGWIANHQTTFGYLLEEAKDLRTSMRASIASLTHIRDSLFKKSTSKDMADSRPSQIEMQNAL